MTKEDASLEIPPPSPLASAWTLDPDVVFLNHGSFGATPRTVLDRQAEIRRLMEAEPLQFFDHLYQEELDGARSTLGEFVGAPSDGLAFVANATTGVNTVLASLSLRPGDQLVTTDHEYNACRNALVAAAERAGAEVVVVSVPFPVRSAGQVIDAVVDGMGPRCRLLLIDHVTSQTGLVLPLDELAAEAHRREVAVLVDGAHAPGMVDLDLHKLGVAYYTGNLHKWVCAPKGAAFLYVREDLREQVRPLVISHGANASSATRSRFHLEHDWTGTRDPSAWLSVESALATVASLASGGWAEVRDLNRQLALEGRRIVCRALGVEVPSPDGMIGSLASIPLTDGDGASVNDIFPFDALQLALFERYRIEVPIISWPERPKRLVRISAQLYNQPDQYRYLAEALLDLL
jgi:isopenicillin-N epimerase